MGYINEIRVDIDHIDSYSKNRIRSMGRAICMNLLMGIGQFEIPNTETLLVNFRADVNFCGEKELFNIGCDLNGHIGSVFVSFDKDYFQKCNDDLKKQYILERIEYAILKYAEKFDLEIEPILKGIELTKQSKFLVKNSNELRSKNGKNKAQLFVSVNYLDKEYWLKVTHIKENCDVLLFVSRKENFFGVEHPELTISELLEITQTMTIEGWIDNNHFQMSWGRETFLYDLEQNKIITPHQ